MAWISEANSVREYPATSSTAPVKYSTGPPFHLARPIWSPPVAFQPCVCAVDPTSTPLT